MELFDFVDTLFNRKAYLEVPDSIKRKHFFMAQRFMSMRFPLQADQFNRIGINQVVAMDYWSIILSTKYSRKPSFLYNYNKTIKKKDKVKATAIDRIKEDVITYYLKITQRDRRDFEFDKEIFPDEVLEELKNLTKAVKDDGIKLSMQ